MTNFFTPQVKGFWLFQNPSMYIFAVSQNCIHFAPLCNMAPSSAPYLTSCIAEIQDIQRSATLGPTTRSRNYWLRVCKNTLFTMIIYCEKLTEKNWVRGQTWRYPGRGIQRSARSFFRYEAEFFVYLLALYQFPPSVSTAQHHRASLMSERNVCNWQAHCGISTASYSVSPRLQNILTHKIAKK